VGKSIRVKYNFAFFTVGDAREKGTFDLIFNLKYFIHREKFQWPNKKLLYPPP